MANNLSVRQLNREVKRLKAKLVDWGLKPERLPTDAHFRIAAQDGAELVEDVSQRARNRKVFIHKDTTTGQPTGQVTALHTIGSIHYQDSEEGTWLDTDTQLVPSEEPGWDWEMSKSHWRLLAKNNGWVAAEKQGVGIGWKLAQWGYLNKTTKEYIVKGQADYSSPIVDGSSISWEIFANVTLKLWATPDQLKEDIEIPQAQRDAVIANNPYGADGYLVYIYEVKWDKCPRIDDEEQGEQSPEVAWGSNTRIFLKNAAGKILSVLPTHLVKHDALNNIEVPAVKIRRYFIKRAGKYYLLFGVPISKLSQMPTGTIIFDPTVDETVGAGSDDSHQTASYWDNDAVNVQIGHHESVGEWTAGWLFTTVNVPQDAPITTATIKLLAHENDSDVVKTKISCEDADDPGTFANAGVGPRTRTQTDAKVDWDPAAWTAGVWYTSPPFTASVQEVVNRGGWAANQDMVVLIANDGSAVGETRQTRSFELGQGGAQLSITYTPPPPSSLTADAIIKKALTGSFTADAYLRPDFFRLPADAVIFKAQQASIIADAILKKTESDALDADAVLFQTSSGSLAADGVLFKTISDAIPGDAYLTYGVFADGVIFKTQQASFSADAIIFPIQHIFMKAGPIYIPVYPLT